MGCEEAVDEQPIADVAVHEKVAGLTVYAGQVLEIARIGQGVQIDHRLVAVGQPVQHEIAADESGAAGNQNHFARPLRCRGGVSKLPIVASFVVTTTLVRRPVPPVSQSGRFRTIQNWGNILHDTVRPDGGVLSR